MRLDLALSGDLARWTKDLGTAVNVGSTKALRITTFGMRKNLRQRITRAGFKSPGLSRALAAKVTREEGRVYSVARFRAGATRSVDVDLIAVFQQGTTITGNNARYVAIPTGQGPRGTGRSSRRFARPAELAALGWRATTIQSKGGNLLVLATSPNGLKIITHVLVRQVSLRARYDLEPGVKLWEDKFFSILAGEVNQAAEARNV